MIVPETNKTVRGIAIAALAGTACWGLIFIGIAWYFNWSTMALWFLSLATIFVIVMAVAMTMQALSEPEDDEHEDHFIG